MDELDDGREADTPPNVARTWDHYIGGTDHLPVDVEFAAEVDTVFPAMGEMCRSHRAFSWAVVDHLCRAGVRQFLELGSGLPTVDHVHTRAARHHPDRRVVYVEIDPLTAAHARSLVRGEEGVAVLQADVADAAAVLSSSAVTTTFDPGRPVAVLACAILHYLDDDAALAAVRAYRDALGAGGWLAVSCLTGAGRPDVAEWAGHRHGGRSYGPILRSPAEMDPWLEGFDPVGGRWVSAPHWTPDAAAPSPLETRSGIWGVVARRH